MVHKAPAVCSCTLPSPFSQPVKPHFPLLATCPCPCALSPKEYLHSVELKDVVQFGSSATSVFLRLKVQDVPHVFQFETKYGGEVCFLLKSHIYDIMAKRFQKVSAGMAGNVDEGGHRCLGRLHLRHGELATSKGQRDCI